MAKKKEDKEIVKYDLKGSTDPKVDHDEIELLEKKVFALEKSLRENGLEDLLERSITDEEYICVKAIESIRKLVANEVQTKDDINMFDVLYKNLCIIRGIKVKKEVKEKPKTQEELYQIINGGKK